MTTATLFPMTEENLMAYANSFATERLALNKDEAIRKIVASHVGMREREAASRRWFRTASYWRRLLLTLSGYPW